MQFNSYEFVLLFLPIFLLVYFVGNRISKKASRWIIIAAGLVFYYFAGLESFEVFLISAAVNLIFAIMINHNHLHFYRYDLWI